MQEKWEEKNERLCRSISFKTFQDALAFVQQVGDLAEQIGHHPEIHILYTTIQLQLWSHDAGAITERDRQLARAIDELIEQHVQA